MRHYIIKKPIKKGLGYYDMYPLYWTKPVEGDFLCATAMNSKESVLICIVKDVGQIRPKELKIQKDLGVWFEIG